MAEGTPAAKKATEPIIELVERVPLSYIVAALVVGALVGCAALILYDVQMSKREDVALDETASGNGE